MRKLYLITLLSALCLSFVCTAQKRNTTKHTVFVGPALLPALQVEGFEDFDISDWQDFGLKSQNPASAEGRVRVPMKGRVSPGPTYGLAIGYTYSLNKAFSVSGIMPWTFSKNIVRPAFLAGITYHVLNKPGLIFTDDAFKIGLYPLVGFDVASVTMGKIKQIPGYTSPVVLKQGTFNDGDNLQVNALGFAYQLGLTFEYEATRKLSFILQAGYGDTAYGKLDVQVDGNDAPPSSSSSSNEESESIKIKLKDAAIVKPDLSATQANVNPKVSSEGLFSTVSIGFRFGKK